jgi:hypothetical protein
MGGRQRERGQQWNEEEKRLDQTGIKSEYKNALMQCVGVFVCGLPPFFIFLLIPLFLSEKSIVSLFFLFLLSPIPPISINSEESLR